MERDQIVELDLKHVWHPYTSSEHHASMPMLVIRSAKGCWLEDINGQRYFDANGQWWVNTLGHAHPRLVKCVQDQVETLAHCSLGDLTHEPAVELAKELCDIAPAGLGKVFFSDNGSTSVETALKIATQYFQQNGRPEKKRFATLAGAFHGDTAGAMSLGVDGVFTAMFGPILFEVVRPLQARDWGQTFQRFLELVESKREDLAGVVLEPFIQGAHGMRMWPEAQGVRFLQELRALTKTHHILLILDEVFVGYGRTGRMFACDKAEVSPDLLCLSKAFSGGMFPMAATLAQDFIYEGFRGGADRALLHGHTYCGNPLGASVAREVLRIYKDEQILERVATWGEYLAFRWQTLAARRGISNLRSMGMVAALDVGEDGYHGTRGWKVYEAALRRNIYLRPLGDTIYLTPPFVIEKSDIDWLVDNVAESIEETY